jgi:GNAT superfamily N-acetyltransferase
MPFINALQENFFAIGRYWGRFNPSVTVKNSIYTMSTGIPSADLNWAWNEKPLMIEDIAEVSSIKNHYRQLDLPFWWWVYPCGKSPLAKETLQDAGFSFLTAIPCLAVDLSTFIPDVGNSTDIAVSLVRNIKDLSLWEETSFTGFTMDNPSQKQYHNFVASFDISSTSPQKLFLAYTDEKPVATALLFFHKNTAGIYFVSTLSAYRRKGIGLAITRAAMQYAKQAGFKYCILQSSDSGLNVYKQAGFKEYCNADIYHSEPAPL